MLPLAWILCAPLVLQESCPNCLHQGVLPCKKHVDVPRDEEEPSDENRLVYCSWAAACPDCGGTLYVDCPKCASGERSKEIEERRNLIRSWMENSQLDRALGRPVPRLETKRFSIAVDVAEIPTEEKAKKKITGHQLAHQFAQDLEHVAGLVAEHYKVTEPDYRAKMRMWLWSTLADHQKCQEKFQGTITKGDFKLLGRDPVFSVWTEPGNFDTEAKLRALFVHNSAHMLTSNLFQPTWVGDIGGGWLDAGIGHWYEYELFGRTVNYCLEEATLSVNYENGRWRAALRRRLEHEKDPFLPGLLPKRTGQLTADEHALCWSFYDYLLATHPGLVRDILTDLKQKKPARDVLAARLGMDLFKTEEAWRAWVSENYPLKGDAAKADPGKAKKK